MAKCSHCSTICTMFKYLKGYCLIALIFMLTASVYLVPVLHMTPMACIYTAPTLLVPVLHVTPMAGVKLAPLNTENFSAVSLEKIYFNINFITTPNPNNTRDNSLIQII